MTDYNELVKALRDTDFGDTCVYCEQSDMCKEEDCIILQAAAAIEALQAQLPKRGEWKVDMSHFSPYIVCSVCGVEIPCVAGWCMDAHMNYCPNCGANMEAQE